MSKEWTQQEIKWLEQRYAQKMFDDSYQFDECHLLVSVKKEDEYCYRASASDNLNLIETDDVGGDTMFEAIKNACLEYNKLSENIYYARIESECLVDECNKAELSCITDEVNDELHGF